MRSLVMPMLVTSLLAVAPASSQVTRQDEEPAQIQPPPQQPSTLPPTRPGEVARSATGQAGQRQTREGIAQEAGIEPMARISSRVQNRVQSRVRNRIDRYYDPQANAASPFVIAGEQARSASRNSRR